MSFRSDERAKLVDDFISRRKEADINKRRGQAELFGPGRNEHRPPSGTKVSDNEKQQHKNNTESNSFSCQTVYLSVMKSLVYNK